MVQGAEERNGKKEGGIEDDEEGDEGIQQKVAVEHDGVLLI